MKQTHFSWLTIAFGIVLAIGEIVRNFGDWQWWPFWLVDFIAAGLLVWGGLKELSLPGEPNTVICGAWGFTFAMFYMSFWSHMATIEGPTTGNFAHAPLTVIIGVMFFISAACFTKCLVAEWLRRRP